MMIHSFLRINKFITPELPKLVLLTAILVGLFSPLPALALTENGKNPESPLEFYPGENPFAVQHTVRQTAFAEHYSKDDHPQPAYPPIRYTAQSGDTLQSVASHFGIGPEEISSPGPLPEGGFLTSGQLLLLPPMVEEMRANHITIDLPQRLPDSEVIYSPSAADFDVSQYLEDAGGYLSQHREYLGSTSWTPAADVINRIALENSINPRLLLALMEYECGCVLGDSPGNLGEGYVLGVEQYEHQWLYGQLGWAANELSKGYYGWRSGTLSEISLLDGIILRPAPDLNTGSVAVLYYFASLATQKATQKIPTMQRHLLDTIPVDDSWRDALDSENSFFDLYQRMFGDAQDRASSVGPLFPEGIQQPDLQLPFEPGFVWSYTSGPHKAWQTERALAALDFAPQTKRTGCFPSTAWVVAAADGPVTRTGDGYVIQDLDDSGIKGEDSSSDSNEFTGWALLYMHIHNRGKAAEGTYLKAGDPVGHPSCEGGPATGTHLHFARKYNGEWVAADGPLPLILSGWRVHAGESPYEGTLTKDDQVVIAHPWGSFDTLVGIPADGSPPIPFQKIPYNELQEDHDPRDKFD